MVYCIFRKSDREMLYQAHSAQQAENEWQACLRNEGGGANDFLRLEREGPVPFGYVVKLSHDGRSCDYVVDPGRIAAEAARARKLVKLKKLGLTEEEINA